MQFMQQQKQKLVKRICLPSIWEFLNKHNTQMHTVIEQLRADS